LQPHRSVPVIGALFYELHSVESTNNYALDRIHAGMAHHGDCFFAHEQTKGKGQRGKDWISEKSSNIILSIVLKPDFLKTYQQFPLSACMAVATENFLRELAGEDTRIKWPNDIYWKDRKAGGILIENVLGGSDSEAGTSGTAEHSTWKWSVVGIGININQTNFSNDIPNPVSLKQITGKNFEVIQLAKKLCRYVNNCYDQLCNGGSDQILQQFNDRLFKKNETVKLKKNNKTFQAIVTGVDTSGMLIVRHAIEEKFGFGDVEWLIN
jgi:BirA family transcriptional regulator, biotin operon repressor / biotin---[acetyl-CoA-carboxylase] ligase